MNSSIILILPGWQDSEPGQWQSLWLKKYPNTVKVTQKDWMYPKKAQWVETLNDYINEQKGDEIVLVAHSIACPTVAFWAQEYPDSTTSIKAAMLVAPADSQQEDLPKEIQGFSPMPNKKLPFKSVVVASENDPHATLERAMHFAKQWGSEFINIGKRGHINWAEGLGEWEEGEGILTELLW